jgi:hypothetical protein
MSEEKKENKFPEAYFPELNAEKEVKKIACKVLDYYINKFNE